MFITNIYLLAFLYIIYGIFKTIGILLLLFLPEDQISNIPILKNYISFAKDKTLAGHFYDYIMIIFCLYTICYGFSILQYFPTNVDNIFENKIFIYLLYFILGLVSLIFYTLVLYTNLPISKDLKNSTDLYKLYMLFGSSFILIPIIKETAVYLLPYLIYHVSEISQTNLIIGIFIIISIICQLIYEFYINKNDTIPITTK
jgi:hypothetical protein